MAEYKPTQYPPTPLDTRGHLIIDYSNVNAQLQYEAGRFDRMVSAKLMAKDIWNRLIQQEEFPEGLGTAIQSLSWERVVVPDVGPTAWTDVTLNDGVGNSCIFPMQVLEYARTIKSYNLQTAAFRTPYLCVEDVRYAFRFGDQLAEMYKVIEANSEFFTSNRYRDEYLRLVGNHIVTDVADTNAMSNTGSNQPWPASRPLYALDQGMLDTIYLNLDRDSTEGAYGMADGQALYALITSAETSTYLKKMNAETRQDLRFSSHVDELLKPFGVGWSYGGFIHLIDRQAPRYTFAGGVFTRVPYYINSPATVGQKAIVNPAYIRAPYEVSFVFNKEVMISRVPNVITNPGGNVHFKATNYRGKTIWHNVQDNDTNMEGTNGFFYCKWQQGSEPNRTEWGYAIMHQRCSPVTQYKSCS